MRVAAILQLVALPVLVTASSGTECVACQLGVGLFERLAMRFDTTVKEATKLFCADLFPKDHNKSVCDDLFAVVAPLIEIDYELKRSPQHTCTNSFKLCQNFSTCSLYPVWPPPGEGDQIIRAPVTGTTSAVRGGWDEFGRTHRLPPARVTQLRDWFNFLALGVGVVSPETTAWLRYGRARVQGAVADHLPEVDLDHDRFGTFATLRGSHWRGKDCNDLDSAVYPGRDATTKGAGVDHNCNGIYGVDAQGVSYEQKWCANSSMRGVIAIGDSATAHFHLPPQWLNAATMDNSTYINVVDVGEDEIDFPHCSMSTGHLNASSCPVNLVNMSSIYLKLFNRNRCNHRDFQNLGVNGARSTSGGPPKGTAMAMKARNGTDRPALVLYSMIGNDVCNGHAGFAHMTSPADFKANVLETLQWLNEHLPPKSFVVMSGLVDGRLLFDTMHAQQHPVGTTYEAVYDMLNCVQVSPCWGWLNSNETARNMTTEHARSLNAQYQIIMKQNASSFANLQLHYLDSFFLLDSVVQQWIAQGNDPVDLIEPSDGFHPSQTTNSLLANLVWFNLTQDFPAAVGPVNAFNGLIEQQFKDQGGY